MKMFDVKTKEQSIEFIREIKNNLVKENKYLNKLLRSSCIKPEDAKTYKAIISNNFDRITKIKIKIRAAGGQV